MIDPDVRIFYIKPRAFRRFPPTIMLHYCELKNYPHRDRIGYIEFCRPGFAEHIQDLDWSIVQSYGFNPLIDGDEADEVKDWLQLTHPEVQLRT